MFSSGMGRGRLRSLEYQLKYGTVGSSGSDQPPTGLATVLIFELSMAGHVP